MMFKQILSYKELVDLSVKKTNLNQTISANNLPRIIDLIHESDGDELSVITTDCQLFQNDALMPVLEGNMDINLSLSCQRCLGQLNWKTTISIYIEFSDILSEPSKYHSRVDKIEIDNEGISIEKVIEDEILANVPMSIMHKNVELCENNDTVGMFLTSSSGKAKKETQNTPFSALSDLMKKNKK